MASADALVNTLRHTHPVILLGTLWSAFGPLVRDPPIVLAQLLAITATIQIAYVSVCLRNNRSIPATSKRKPTRPSGKGNGDVIVNNILPAILALILATIAGTPILCVLIVLFGAPVTTHLAHTLFCASHLSLLAVFPLIYTHQVQASSWREIISLQLPMNEVYGGSLGACLGAWLGAIPIPLDWDREWQKWPVTIVVGIYLGYAAGRLVGSVLKTKSVKFY